MSAAPAPDALLAAVEKSPAAVAVHDRDAWLALFAREAEVCDPVGSRPHRGRAQLAAFYETFIAPNAITFHVEHDVVAGRTVFRDLTLETVMGAASGGDGASPVALHVPMHLRYDVIDPLGTGRVDDLRLELLHAHWELPSMIGQLLGHGVAGAAAGASLVPRLLRNQRLAGSLGFGRALRRAGDPGKATAQALFAALASGDEGAVRRVVAPDVDIELPGAPGGRATLDPAAKPRDLRWRKLLSAGMTVTATVEMDGVRGVALLEFERPDQVRRARLFLPAP